MVKGDIEYRDGRIIKSDKVWNIGLVFSCTELVKMVILINF